MHTSGATLCTVALPNYANRKDRKNAVRDTRDNRFSCTAPQVMRGESADHWRRKLARVDLQSK